MIDSNLAVLLAERNLKITKVSRDTGISRTTLTALCYDHSGGIKFDTLNTLCNYLGITPAEFFSYSQYDYEIRFLGETDYEDTFLKKMEMARYEYTINIIIRRANMTWTYPVRGICGDFKGDGIPYDEATIGVIPYYFDNYDDFIEDGLPVDATAADMAAAREYDRMVAEMTVRQHNDMTKAILDMVQEAFVDDYAKDNNLDPSEVPTDEQHLKRISKI